MKMHEGQNGKKHVSLCFNESLICRGVSAVYTNAAFMKYVLLFGFRSMAVVPYSQ